MIDTVVAAIGGAILASVLACVPGLHVYNVMGIIVMAVHAATAQGAFFSPETTIGFAAGMIVGYSMLNTIPSVLVAAPDESAFFTVLPGQKHLMRGRGYEAVVLTTVGGAVALLVIVPTLGAFGPSFLPMARRVLGGHTHWILWCVIAFMLMSEWPKSEPGVPQGWKRFAKSWRSLTAGLLTFVLSGLLGFVLLYGSPVSSDVAFQNLMPAFVGLFTLPWLILNVLSGIEAPPQTMNARVDAASTVRGAIAGGLGGGFAAFFPVITGGVGGFLAGHATALREDRSFLVSQGASKVFYYVGGFLLFFVPGVNLTRGGAAWLMRGVYVPETYQDYDTALAAVAIAGMAALLLIYPLSRLTIAVMLKFGYRAVSVAAFVAILILLISVTGLGGLAVAGTATAIGLVPVLYGSRRMNCLGVILLPMACNMSGVGSWIAERLGLM